MSMGIGINTQNPDEGELKRDLEEIACGVWFTSTGAVMPKLVKYQDEEGLLHTISQIRVLTQDKNSTAASPSRSTGAVRLWKIRNTGSASTIIWRQAAGRSVGKACSAAGERRKSMCGRYYVDDETAREIENWYGIWTEG